MKHLENSKKRTDDMERKKMQLKEKEEILEAIRMKVSIFKFTFAYFADYVKSHNTLND